MNYEDISYPFQVVTFTVRVQSYAQSKQANDLLLKHKPIFRNTVSFWNSKVFHVKVSAHLVSREGFQSKMTDSNLRH